MRCSPFRINPEPLPRRKRVIAPTERSNKPNKGCESTSEAASSSRSCLSHNSYTFQIAPMRKMVLEKHNVEPCHGDKCHLTVRRQQASSQVGGAAVCLTVDGGQAALQYQQHQHRAHGHKAPRVCPSRSPRSLHFPRRTGGQHPCAEEPR